MKSAAPVQFRPQMHQTQPECSPPHPKRARQARASDEHKRSSLRPLTPFLPHKLRYAGKAVPGSGAGQQTRPTPPSPVPDPAWGQGSSLGSEGRKLLPMVQSPPWLSLRDLAAVQGFQKQPGTWTQEVAAEGWGHALPPTAVASGTGSPPGCSQLQKLTTGSGRGCTCPLLHGEWPPPEEMVQSLPELCCQPSPTPARVPPSLEEDPRLVEVSCLSSRSFTGFGDSLCHRAKSFQSTGMKPGEKPIRPLTEAALCPWVPVEEGALRGLCPGKGTEPVPASSLCACPLPDPGPGLTGVQALPHLGNMGCAQVPEHLRGEKVVGRQLLSCPADGRGMVRAPSAGLCASPSARPPALTPAPRGLSSRSPGERFAPNPWHPDLPQTEFPRQPSSLGGSWAPSPSTEPARGRGFWSAAALASRLGGGPAGRTTDLACVCLGRATRACSCRTPRLTGGPWGQQRAGQLAGGLGPGATVCNVPTACSAGENGPRSRRGRGGKCGRITGEQRPGLESPAL